VQTVSEAMSFGELALMYNAPRAATVTAKQNCKLWLLDRTTFKNILMDTTIKKRKLHNDFLLNVPILGIIMHAVMFVKHKELLSLCVCLGTGGN
jgi:cAMP-dependent protein kinase regulator